VIWVINEHMEKHWQRNRSLRNTGERFKGDENFQKHGLEIVD
jgi:hypothetical protein